MNILLVTSAFVVLKLSGFLCDAVSGDLTVSIGDEKRQITASAEPIVNAQNLIRSQSADYIQLFFPNNHDSEGAYSTKFEISSDKSSGSDNLNFVVNKKLPSEENESKTEFHSKSSKGVSRGEKRDKVNELRHKTAEESGGKKKSEFDEDDNATSNHKESKGGSHSKSIAKKKDRRGRFEKGFHNKYHKNESRKRSKFFKNHHEGGEFENFAKKFKNQHSKQKSSKSGKKSDKGEIFIKSKTD